MLRPRHPTLYRLADDGKTVNILFGRCRACECFTFPANAYGCARCGSAELETVERPGEGRLIARVTLHAAVMPGLPVPQAIGDVEIAPGIREEVLLVDDVDRLAPGAVVYARAHALDDGTFDCRFGPERPQ